MKVLVVQPLPKDGVELLKQRYEVTEAQHVLSKEEIVRSIKDADAIVCSTNNLIDSQVIAAAKKAKVISNLGAGFNNIDIEAAGKRKIAVTNTPGVLGQTVAELVFGHILALSRKIVESDRYIRSGQFTSWNFELMVGMELRGKTLGVIGFGSVGQYLAPIAKGFGMRLIYTNRQGPLEKFRGDTEVQFVSKDYLLQNADVVVLLVPLNSETKHLISYAELSKMKPTAFLVNMARGPVVKESDLVRALQEKKIAGAGLDVFEFEPSVSQELIALPNTVVTPHIGSATREARSQLSLKAAYNVIAILEGKQCENIVNSQYLNP